MSQSYTHGGSSVTRLDHDHRKSENVRFLTAPPPNQDLRRSPPRGVVAVKRGGRYGIQVLNDGSETKIRDACMTGVVHKDVRLVECQYGSATRFRTATYSLEAPMNHIAGVDVAQALSNVR